MFGFVVAALLFGVAWYVQHYNATHSDSYMLLPLLDGIPSLQGDIPAQADLSWKIVAAVGVVVLIANTVTVINRARRRKVAAEGDDDGA